MSGISQYIPEGKTGRVTATVAEAILWEETPLYEGGEEKDREKKEREVERGGISTVSD